MGFLAHLDQKKFENFSPTPPTTATHWTLEPSPPPLPPPTMMLSVGGGSLWLQWVAVVGGAGEKFSIFFDPNELKSPKKQHLFLLFFF